MNPASEPSPTDPGPPTPPVAVDQFVLLEHDARLDACAVDRGRVLAREMLLEADAGNARLLGHWDDGAAQPHDVGGDEEAVHHDLRDQFAKDLDLLVDGPGELDPLIVLGDVAAEGEGVDEEAQLRPGPGKRPRRVGLRLGVEVHDVAVLPAHVVHIHEERVS
ncbi:MAG: hypothetical protein E6K12_03570 [Methanobacteriota archaeon]|nr:MAG: hypothetical protein E6K12_03570 [Euryarchaeota archaeon]